MLSSLLAVVAAGAFGRPGFAHPHPGGPEGRGGPGPDGEHPGAQWFRARVEAHVTDALDVAKATPEQRKAVQAEVDALLAKGKGGMDRHHQQRKAAVEQFVADKPDAKAIAVLVQQFVDTRLERAKDLAAALTRLHPLFRPEQRKAIAGYVADVVPAPRGSWQHKMARFWTDRMTDRAMDHLHCTAEQRRALGAIREKVHGRMASVPTERRKHLDGALQLWQGDRLDAAAVQAHLDASAKHHKELAEFAVDQALEVHKVLTAEQRGKLAEFLRNHHGRRPHGGRHGGHGGPGGPAEGEE
ncbi:MAG: Spy/CpxP family protein refolding chaperone [Deltaproteobacteria bacterium]|nr:Spy/CpxP family protein refolding chaperone [Deltaproteobacteria bacterium]